MCLCTHTDDAFTFLYSFPSPLVFVLRSDEPGWGIASVIVTPAYLLRQPAREPAFEVRESTILWSFITLVWPLHLCFFFSSAVPYHTLTCHLRGAEGMLSSPLVSSFRSCRSPSSDSTRDASESSPLTGASPKTAAPQPFSSLPRPETASLHNAEQAERAERQLASLSSSRAASLSTADTLSRLRARRRSSFSPRNSSTGGLRAQPSSPLATRVVHDVESEEVVRRRQRVDRAMLSDREADGRHALHRQEQDVYMRVLVPFYQLLRTCARQSTDRDEPRLSSRRLSQSSPRGSSSGSPLKTEQTPPRHSPAAPQCVDTTSPVPLNPAWLGSRVGIQSLEHVLHVDVAALCEAHQYPARPTVGAASLPADRSRPHASAPLAPSSTSPSRWPSYMTAASSSPSLTLRSSPSRRQSIERALIEAMNALEQEVIADGDTSRFVGRVSWLMAEETVARAEVCAAEAYDWQCLRSSR